MTAKSLETQSLFSAAQQSLEQVQELFADPGFLRKLEEPLQAGSIGKGLGIIQGTKDTSVRRFLIIQVVLR